MIQKIGKNEKNKVLRLEEVLAYSTHHRSYATANIYATIKKCNVSPQLEYAYVNTVFKKLTRTERKLKTCNCFIKYTQIIYQASFYKVLKLV